MHDESYPVAVIGAGPIGLAAAVHLWQRGETPLVFEAADGVGGNIRSWAHVATFSPWRFNVDALAVELLKRHGWQMPAAEKLPTGQEIIDEYLAPLSRLPELAPHIHFNTKVTGVSRRRTDKMKDARRESAPFVIYADANGVPRRFLARAVIDASGTWATPNPIGSDGMKAPGEAEHHDRIFYGIPDVLGTQAERYANKTVAVIGGGHSAINAILDLRDLQRDHPQTNIIWLLRKGGVSDAFGGLESDALPGRGLLGIRIKELVERDALEVITPFFLLQVESAGNGLNLIGETPAGERRVYADEVIAATGSRPDLSFLHEVRISLDPAVESPPALAPLIDPNVHSCGTVRPHGESELRHPENDFYIVGMKSYGRAPTFLLATGYEQVRSVVAALVGDWEAARRVELVLPETGVCGASVPGADLLKGAGCCGPTAEAPEIEQPQELANACCDTVDEVVTLIETNIPVASTDIRQKLAGCCSPDASFAQQTASEHAPPSDQPV